MKKLLLVLAIGAFVACNESATEETTTTPDSAASTVDQNTTVAPADTSATAAPADTSATKADSAATK